MNRIFKSFGYAARGIRMAVSEQPNIRIHLMVSILVVIAGFYIGISRSEWLVILLCIGVVLAVELLNTAIEYLVDLVSPERHSLAGKVKDVAAGAVLIVAIMSVIIGILIFSKYIG
jgi:diacylglycerol kinase (ATP)